MLRCLLLLAVSCLSFAQDRVTIGFDVNVPGNTDPSATVFLSGNLDETGSWRPDALPLTRRDGRWFVEVSLPLGAELQYKFTLGSWETVEKGSEGEELDNRRLTARRDDVVRITVARWRNNAGEAERVSGGSITGDLRVHGNFRSSILGNSRRLLVWLPPGYDPSRTTPYPVLYMQDGQNLFDTRTGFGGMEWNVDETADRLIRARRIRPLIVVGIENTPSRVEEYTPSADPGYGGGRGEDYARFLLDEVKPFIDRTYRTDARREGTGVAGSSLGGLISLYLCKARPDAFSRCAAMSPSLWWDDRRLLRECANDDAAWMSGKRFWIDVGTAEGGSSEVHVQNARDLAGVFAEAGLRSGRDYTYFEDRGAGHNERAWSARFERVLRFLYAR